MNFHAKSEVSGLKYIMAVGPKFAQNNFSNFFIKNIYFFTFFEQLSLKLTAVGLK